MANASTTQTSSASDTTGKPIPLTYGYAWVSGKRAEYYTLENTNDTVNVYTRLGIWLLGHGEWDGCSQLWINDLLVWNGGSAPALHQIRTYGWNWLAALDNIEGFVFNFHPGCDTPYGASLTPSSTGPDQNVDLLWTLFPPAIQPLAYSRIAYYALMRKQPVVTQTSNNGGDPSQWTDIAPIGLWRALKCRLFDAEGNQTGYAFTTNPAWHFVDVLLRRKIMPDYNLDQSAGPDTLYAAVRNRFDWGSIYTAAQYFDEFLPNGRRRFEGNYSFATQTTLQAVLEQILLCCRSFCSEYAGKISLRCDMPRSSVFTFSRSHILPGSWDADDQTLHKSANRYIAHFRDLLVPLCSYIESISCPSNSNPVVTTTSSHPFQANDRIAIGGTNTTYDGEWEVLSVPDVINPGATNEIDPTTFTLVSKGSNYPVSVGQVGGCGLLYSRFKERTPEFWHKTNMLARGTIGLGIMRLRNKVKQTLDFATSTWDQASRLSCYERDRLLGLDQSPYVTPPCVKLSTSMFARDAFGNLACAVRPGDHVTLDNTANFQYAGEYEVLEPLTVYPPAARPSAQGASIALRAAESSGRIEFVLGPYNEAVMYDTSDPTQAGWPIVPGSDPGNESNYTGVSLANGGTFVFFSGQLPSGQAFQLPSSGFPVGNMLAWASAAGASVPGNDHSAAAIVQCGVGATRLLTLNYSDWEGFQWNGDVNYAALTWLSPDVPTTSNGLTWLELTLPGGEVILWGNGILANGATIVLPTGYSAAQSFAVAEMHDGPTSGNNVAHMMGAYVDSTQIVHYDVTDGSGNHWYGNASVLVFAWKNNMGTVTTQALTGSNWMQVPLSNGTIFGAGCAKNLANGATFVLPAAAGDGSTLEVICGSSNGLPEANTQHAQGIGSCYLDASNILHMTFQDGSGDLWDGTADVFGVFCTPAAAAPTLVQVTPSTSSVLAGTTQQFTSIIQNNANTNVTWSVDGIAGGNVTVGTINASGLYSAPSAAGSHTITATSVATPSASGSSAVSVWAGSESGGGWVINGS